MRTLARVLVGIATILAVVGVLAYMLRDSIATKGAAVVLDRKPGMRCTHPELRVDGSLELVTVSPVDCSIAKGPLARFSTQSDMEVQLKGFGPKRIHIARATMDQRQRDVSHVESNTLGDLANLVGLRDQLAKGMLDAAELCSPDTPPQQMDTVVSKRAGKKEAVMHGFRQSVENGWCRQFAERVESGPDIAAIRNFDMRVTPKRGVLTLDIFLGKPKPGDKPDMTLKMQSENLDAKKPYFKLST